MAITPSNSYFPQQWNLRLIRAPEAWEALSSKGPDLTFGRSDIIVAVIDKGVETALDPLHPGTVLPTHVSFQGNVRGSIERSKAVGFVRWDGAVYFDNNTISGSHGSVVAGIAVASAQHAATNHASNSAITGVAPNCRFLSADIAVLAEFYWAANMGLHYGIADLRPAFASLFSLPPDVQADIFNLSFSVTGMPGYPWNMPFDCSTFGRRGRGVIIVQTAGNEYGAFIANHSDRCIVVGATMIGDGDPGTDEYFDSERRASYSNYGKRLDLCGPAGGGQNDLGANKRRTYGPVPKDCGTFDVDLAGVWEVTISRTADKTYSVVSVQDTDVPPGAKVGIFAGQFISIGNPANDTYEERRITSADHSGALSVIGIDTKFNSAAVALAPVAARVAYPATTTSGSTSQFTIPLSDARGFGADQWIYIHDGVHFDIRKTTSVVGNTLQLNAALALPYGAGARVVPGGRTLAITGLGDVVVSDTPLTVAGTGFFVGQMVRITASAPLVDRETEITKVAPGPTANTSTVRVFGKFVYSPLPSQFELTTIGGGEYTSNFDGTSAAAPVVSGAAALVLSANPALNWVEVRHILEETAHKVEVKGGGWRDENDRRVFTIFGLQEDFPSTFLTAQALVDARVIDVDDATHLSKDIVVRLSSGLFKHDFATVLSVSGRTVTLDRPLGSTYDAGDTVKVGRRAYRSDEYGRGRIDAGRAVEMALAWDVNARDLWIRASLADLNGTRPIDAASIDSPDIWVRNTSPLTEGAAALPSGNAAGPHQLPVAGHSTWIYVRIRNRGSQPSLRGMEIVLTYTDTSDPVPLIQFPFPDKWQPRVRTDAPYAETTVLLTPVEKSLLQRLAFPKPNDIHYKTSDGLPYVTHPSLAPLFEDNPAIMRLPGYTVTEPYVIPPIPGGQDHIAILPWRGADVPSRIKGRAFLKVHISPFDGDASVAGELPDNNNNLAFKEIHIRSIVLLDGTGAELLEPIPIPTSGVIVTEPFTVEIAYIPMTAEKGIVLTVTLTVFDVTTDALSTEQKVFAYDGTVWSFAGGPPTWLAINQPAFSGSTGTDRNQALFAGILFLDNTHAAVSLHVIVNDSSTLVIERTIDVKLKAIPPINANGIGASNEILFRTFTDWDLLPAQDGTKNYGPLPAPDDSTRYRTAAMFTGIQAGGTKLKAYAITAGHAFLQEITGSTTQVNLVFRPLDPIDSPRGPVKYLVYRGLRRDSFLDNTGEVLADAPAVNSDLLNRNWTVRNSLNAEEKHLDPAFVDLKVTRDDLGLTTPPNPPLADATRIGEVFDRYTRWPRIDSGAWIGDFEHTGSYGFEIIVDGPGPEPTLADLRVLDHTIDIIYTPAQPKFANGAEEDIATRAQRERILQYVDPAAFIGLLAGGNIERNTSAGVTVSGSPHPVMGAILQQFATRDVVYLDIRNELNQSLNFYGNYGDGTALNAAQIQIRNAAGAMVPRAYHDHGWPILALKAGVDIPADTTADKIAIRIALPVGDNSDPVLYLAGASFATDFPGYLLKFAVLNPVPGPVTNAFELGVHNDKTDGVVLPAAIRIVYARRYAGATNPVFPATRPLKDDLIDTLLSPDAPALVPPPTGMTTWDTDSELRYVGWTSKTGFDFTVRTGRAQDEFGEIAFAYAEGPAELHGGTSARAIHVSIELAKGKAKTRSFYEHLKNAGLARLTRVPANSGPPIPALRVQSVHDNFSISLFDKSADNLLSIAYSTAEATAIRGLTSQFVAVAPLSFAAINHEMAESGDQFPYFSMNLGVLGSAVAGNTFEVRRIDTGVKVYSFDGRNYFSAAYTNAVELLPFVE